MAAILGDILKYLKVTKEITRDNVFFRIVTDASFGIFILSSIIAGMTTYIGQPIKCHGDGANPLTELHCWLHGTRDLRSDLELDGVICMDSTERDDENVSFIYHFLRDLFCFLLKL